MRLSGWWRLWVALVAIHAVVVIGVTLFLWPDTARVQHHPSFTYRMSDRALTVLNRPGPKPTAELERLLIAADRKGNVDEAKKLAVEIRNRQAKAWSSDPILLEMPNGHRFQVAADTPDSDSELIGREYVRVLQSEVGRESMELAKNAALMWLVPSLAFLVLGLLIHWVYLGFKASKP